MKKPRLSKTGLNAKDNRIRSMIIRRLRGMNATARAMVFDKVVTVEEAATIRMIVDRALEKLKAETETARKIRLEESLRALGERR